VSEDFFAPSKLWNDHIVLSGRRFAEDFGTHPQHGKSHEAEDKNTYHHEKGESRRSREDKEAANCRCDEE